MKNYLTLLLFCSFVANGFSQERTLELWNYLQTGDTIFLANGGHLRESGSRNAKSIAQMPVGTMLIVTGEKTSKEELIYNIKGNYYPVKWESSNGIKFGYLWEGLLANTVAKDKENNRYIFGYKSYSPSDNIVTYALTRVTAEGKIQEFPMKDTLTYHTSFESKVIGGMGLTGVKNIFRVGMLGEACGVPTIYKYYAWDGKQFYNLPEKMSVGDAGVYYYTEELQFPSEHKLTTDVILIKSEEMEYQMVAFKGIPNAFFEEGTMVSKYRFYKWTGKGFHPLEKEEDDE